MADDAEVKSAPAPITYTYEGPSMQEAAKTLAEKKAKYREMGGTERVERQHSQNKLTVRERIDLLFDAGSFT